MSFQGEKFYQSYLEGNLGEVKQYLKHGISYSDPIKGSTDMHVACREGRNSVIKYLLTLPHSFILKSDKDGNSPLMIACKSGKEEIVEMLLEDERTNF